MRKLIEKKIQEESRKLALRYHAYHNNVEIEYQRNKKRFLNPPAKEIKLPAYWAKDRKFNPFYVQKHSRQVSYSIYRKIKKGIYEPNPPHIMEVPKSNGKKRKITVYQIPDAAVSTLYYEQLLSKNKHRFSSFSYAYRNDRNVHFAIQDIAVDLSQHARTFIAEFDFSDFFGSISHEYLFAQFDKNGFFISEEERKIIRSFLLPSMGVGIPQGSSISLFLANLVCWELDRNFEKNGIQFARYADDTVIWSQEYDKICKAFEIINGFSENAGVKINVGKSDGISLLTREGLPSELKSVKHKVDFLGYSISVDHLSIKEISVKKIKKQISYLLYRNLIQPLKGTQLRAVTIPANDKDPAFLTAILQIRRYLYGNLNEKQLRDYLAGTLKTINFKGIMSFYPLLTDEEQLKKLDGWLSSVIIRVLNLRARLLKSWRFNRDNIFPFNATKAELIKRCKIELVNGKPLLEIPSFLRIYRAIQKGLISDGIERVMNPSSSYYE
jgi:hypothetical protein